MRQCNELESCLAWYQSTNSETQNRAQELQRENVVLQSAVDKLCLFSKQLLQSQQSLQQELTQLEVHGRLEPLVFG